MSFYNMCNYNVIIKKFKKILLYHSVTNVRENVSFTILLKMPKEWEPRKRNPDR